MRDKRGVAQQILATGPGDPSDDAAARELSSRAVEHSAVILDGARIAALHDLGLLDSAAEEDFDRYTRLATDLLDVPVSLVSLVDADRQFFKSSAGLSGPFGEARQTPLTHSFCQHAVAARQPLIVNDARAHPLVGDNLAVRDLDVVAYAGMPLVLSDGHAVGAFCAIDAKPRNWTERDVRILADLAAAVRAHLELRKSLAAQSLHDRLTGLANRTLLCAHADRLLRTRGPAAAGSVAAICVGVDGFALVNEAYGAAVGDKLLAQIAERLTGAAGDSDLIGRLEGDTFVVVAGDISDERVALAQAALFGSRVGEQPFEVDGLTIGVTATVGIATGMTDVSGADLLAHSDASIRRSKSSGGVVQVAPWGSTGSAAAQLQLRSALRGAVDRGEIHVAYQPIVALDSARPVSFEALARWNSPELGAISPADFVPVAERSGEIVRIGEWMLHAACAQLARWRARAPQFLATGRAHAGDPGARRRPRADGRGRGNRDGATASAARADGLRAGAGIPLRATASGAGDRPAIRVGVTAPQVVAARDGRRRR